MNRDEFDERLSRISTAWTQLHQAHQGTREQRGAAVEAILRRYQAAIFRYLLRAVGDPNAAEDLAQEFAVRFVEGRFHNADPERGRFRDYVKTVLFHLVDDYRKRQAREPRAESLDRDEPAASAGVEAEQAFQADWRKELLEQAWKGLAALQQESGTPYYDVLRLHVEHPELGAREMAEHLSARLGKALTDNHVRKLLERARKQFAHRVVEETHRSLGVCSRDQLEEELADLKLLKYCQGILRRGGPNG